MCGNRMETCEGKRKINIHQAHSYLKSLGPLSFFFKKKKNVTCFILLKFLNKIFFNKKKKSL